MAETASPARASTFRPVRVPWLRKASPVLWVDAEVCALRTWPPGSPPINVFRLWLWGRDDGALGTLENSVTAPAYHVLHDVQTDRKAAVSAIEAAREFLLAEFERQRLAVVPFRGRPPQAINFVHRGTPNFN
jgi:hypothetical protein